jgi:hypothetical protein
MYGINNAYGESTEPVIIPSYNPTLLTTTPVSLFNTHIGETRPVYTYILTRSIDYATFRITVVAGLNMMNNVISIERIN